MSRRIETILRLQTSDRRAKQPEITEEEETKSGIEREISPLSEMKKG
jgi:hypothetical protein